MHQIALVLALIGAAWSQEQSPKPRPEAAREALPPPPDLPRVLIETSMGTITVQLFPEDSPLSVDNFLGYVRSGLRQHWHVYGVMRDTSPDAR